MSRIGKLPITIPAGVQVTLKDDSVIVKGPKGEVVQVLPPHVTAIEQDGVLTVTVPSIDTSAGRARWGLARQLIANAVQGAHVGYTKKLELSGVGFKVAAEGKDLVLSLGFSHPVRFSVPVGINVTVEKNTVIINGASKQLVGQVAANIRALKKPEPYKGKGFRYSDEIIRRKAGKVVKAAGAK